MISISGVSKKFGKRPALENLSIEVPKGGIYGLLGHNGAGKSTTIGILLGMVFPDAGEARINGADVFQDRRRALSRVGAIFEAPAFYPYLSGARNLKIFCEYTAAVDQKRMDEVIKLAGLEKRIHDPAGTYSHGMRQRLALAQALLPRPRVLILDEPSEGLDPEGIHEMRNLILKLNHDWGLTILFSSHLLGEVQQLTVRNYWRCSTRGIACSFAGATGASLNADPIQWSARGGGSDQADAETGFEYKRG